MLNGPAVSLTYVGQALKCALFEGFLFNLFFQYHNFLKNFENKKLNIGLRIELLKKII